MYVALIDWDNTIHQGYTIYALADHLLAEGLVADRLLHQFEQLKISYAQGSLNYFDYTEQTCAAFARELADTPVTAYRQAVRSFLPLNERSLFPDAEALFELLRKYSIDVYMVSGAPYDVLSGYQERFGIRSIFGFALENQDGVLTGRVATNYGISKDSVLKQAWFSDPKLHHLLSMGDAVADIPLLDSAQIPVVIGKQQLTLGSHADPLLFTGLRWDLPQLEARIASVCLAKSS